MTITKAVGFNTPSSNTGSVSFSSRLDWLQGVFKLTSSELTTLIGEISSTFKDTFASDEGYMFSGRTFDHHRISDRGSRVAWNIYDHKNNDDDHHHLGDRIIDCWLMIPAGVLNGVSDNYSLRKFLALLATLGFKPTRIDLALDDYTKSLTWQNFDDARKAGQAHGFKKGRLTSSFGDKLGDGFTYYMGSSGSDKLYRFYNKNVESNGEIDSYRLEGQFRDDWCKSVWACLLSADTDKKFHQTIVNCVCELIDFYDGDNPKNTLQWWADFKKSVKFEGINLCSGRVKPTIDSSIEWIESQVETTLANIEAFMDRVGDDFASWFNARLESGRKRLRSSHLNKIDSALAVLNIPSHISGQELREGWF